MVTMKTLNGYGFNATELNGKNSDSYLQLGDDGTGSTGEAPKINADTLGGVAASNYLKKNDTASDSAKLGGKAPEYYLQPHNLFDNSNFVDPVMQAEFNGMHGNGQYVIDRWLHLYNLGSSEKVYGGIALTGTDFYMAQKVGEDVSGKTLTFAVCLADGTVVCGTENVGDLSSTIVFAQHENLYLMLYNGCFSIRIATGTYTIKWAALYEGTYTADTLPPYVPKGYASELAECQRYYELVGVHKYSMGRIGEVYFDIQFTQKRISPTVIMALETTSNNIANKGEVWNANRVSAGGLLFYANDENLSYWYGSAKVSADL